MLKCFIDKFADKTIERIESGSTTATPELADRNPANVFGWTGTGPGYFAIDLGDNITPISGVALFGILDGLIGATVGVKGQAAAPIFADFGSPDYEYEIQSDSFYMPLDTIGYDSVNDNYYRYWLVEVNLPFGGSGEAAFGTLAGGLFEQPVVNYRWGKRRSDDSPQIVNTTIAGIDWVNNLNETIKTRISVDWPQLNDQGVAQLRRWYTDTIQGLNPLVVVPDCVGKPDAVYYARLNPSFNTDQNFLNQNGVGLEFIEAIGYEV